MSISRNFDDYLAAHNITPSAEVIPENECQIFAPPTEWFIDDQCESSTEMPHNATSKIDEAAERVHKLLIF